MNDLLSKEVVLKHLGMAMECEDCPRKDCKDIKLNAVEVCSIIRYLATFADVQPVNQWVSVEDRLPEKFEYVLCYCKTTTGEGNEFMFGAYHNDTWWLKTCRTYATLEQPQMRVMYWMPLPEPPKGGDTNG